MPIVWRNTMSKKTKKTEWSKNCPKCGEPQYYNSKYILNRAIKLNRICYSCSNSNKDTSKQVELMRESNTGKARSSETCRKIGEGNRGKIRSISARKRMSVAKSMMSNETKRKISEAQKNKKKSDEHKQKIRISMLQNIENRYGNVYPNYNPSSIPIIEEKARELGITDLQHAENGGEYHIKELGYFVDGYSKEKNIVIEYYELHHKRQIESDNLRKNEIVEHLGCEFIIIEEQKK